MTWRPTTEAPADRIFWAYREAKREVHPARLGTAVGMPDSRLATFPDLRFLVHAHSGQGFFARWWREVETPPEKAENGAGEEQGGDLGVNRG